MATLLSSLSDELAATVASADRGVVRVEGRRRLPGSGIVWSAEGVMVTAHHVLERDENITVGLPDGQSAQATLVGRDPTTDIAVLRAQASGLTPLAVAEPDTLRVGNLVLALGRPGKSVMVTQGIVSALGESWRTPLGGLVDRYLHTDVSMHPGFSGGPLVDVNGHLIGLNTSALLRGSSVTIPASTLRRVVEELLAEGRIKRGYLGVAAQPVRLPSALVQKLGQETGLLLMSIESGGPAERDGLLLGDIVVTLDGQPVRHLDDLLGHLSGDRVGVSEQVRVVRGGRLQQLSITIGERS